MTLCTFETGSVPFHVWGHLKNVLIEYLCPTSETGCNPTAESSLQLWREMRKKMDEKMGEKMKEKLRRTLIAITLKLVLVNQQDTKGRKGNLKHEIEVMFKKYERWRNREEERQR